MSEWSPIARLATFAAVLVIALGGAFGVGHAVGPIGEPAAEATHGHEAEKAADHGDHADEANTTELPGGLQSSADGYTLHLLDRTYQPGQQEVAFHILDADGHVVTAFDEVHEARLHFFAVRRDLSGFAHLHPAIDAEGTWRIDVDLRPGTWRFLADFQPTGADEALTLGRDAFVPGVSDPQPLPAAATTAVVDGYTVELRGDLAAGEGSELTFTLSRDGEPVTDLDPYLGAYGHLVALRDGDLAYLHVHPEKATTPGPEVSFHATAPSAGAYRLFLDFSHGGVVHTAAFTVDVESGHSHG